MISPSRPHPSTRSRGHRCTEGPAISLILLLSLGLLPIGGASAIAQGQDPGDSGEDPAPERVEDEADSSDDEHPEWWAANFEILRTGTLPEKGKAVDTLLAEPHPAQLRPLRDALGNEDRALRVRITNGILGAFPQRAPDFFLGLLDDENIHRREAAVFGLGAIDDARVVPRLVSLLADGRTELEEGSEAQILSEAAARSLLNRGRQAANAAFSRATGRNAPHAERLLAMYAATARDIVSALLSSGREGEHRALLFRRFADAEAVRAVRVALREASPDDPVGATLVALGDKVGAWSPRPSFPVPGTLHYTIHIQNLFVGSEKTVPIHVSDRDLGPLNQWDYALDRAVRCELPIDHLLLDPVRCAPRLEVVEGVPHVRYSLPERTTLEVGIGVLNIAYWSGIVAEGRTVDLVLDPETGLPRTETVRDAEGEVRMVVHYEDFAPLRPEMFAPRTLRVELPRARIGARTMPMRYTYHFVVESGVWRFDSGECFAVGNEEGAADDDPVTLPPGEEEIRAIAAVTDVSWEPAAPAKGPEDTTPADGDAGERSGTDQGEKPPGGSRAETSPDGDR